MTSLIRAYRERKRRDGKNLSVVAAGCAQYVAAYLGGGQVPDLSEVFPFWTDEERKQMKVEKYRRIMERYAAAGGGARNG